MKNKYVFTVVLLAAILAVSAILTGIYGKQQTVSADEDKLLVVTSFYPMYIAAQNVIGECEEIDLKNLSEPQTGCLHDYQLTAEDMKLLEAADVFIVNGGGIENFLTDVAAQYPQLVIIDACKDIELKADNAHVWMNTECYLKQLHNICDGLVTTDPEHEAAYRENEMVYAGQVQKLQEQVQELKNTVAGQPVVLFHEAYAYMAAEYGLTVTGVMDLDEERQVSAGEVTDILTAIEENGVTVILAEELYGQDMGRMMEDEVDVKVIYLDTLTRGDYEADSYLKGMEQNIASLREAFQ